MNTPYKRREFLAEVGRGMLVATVGYEVARNLGLASATAAEYGGVLPTPAAPGSAGAAGFSAMAPKPLEPGFPFRPPLAGKLLPVQEDLGPLLELTRCVASHEISTLCLSWAPLLRTCWTDVL